MPNYKAVAIPFWAAMLTAAIMQVIPIHFPHIKLVDSTEHISSCTANVASCSNEYRSTPGPNGIIRANVNDGALPKTFTPAYNRVVIIFHWEPSPIDFRQRGTFGIPLGKVYCLNGYCPVVKAAIGGDLNHCQTNCYVQIPNTDAYDPTFARYEWWTARIDKSGNLFDQMTGWPTL